MVGGIAKTVAQCQPMLQMYAQNIVHMGPVGCGMAGKLVNQALVCMHAQAACEALHIAQRLGIDDMDLDKLQELLRSSWGQSKVLELVFADYIQAMSGKQSSQSVAEALAVQATAAPLRNLRKDLRCLLDASSRASPLPLLQATQLRLEAACGAEHKLQDAPFVALYNLMLPRVRSSGEQGKR
jgi:3-hydroxyisobutyrate dehydrogenase-like beta-hydroxyacid dehydrogenase